jgi:hypothetical protein
LEERWGIKTILLFHGSRFILILFHRQQFGGFVAIIPERQPRHPKDLLQDLADCANFEFLRYPIAAEGALYEHVSSWMGNISLSSAHQGQESYRKEGYRSSKEVKSPDSLKPLPHTTHHTHKQRRMEIRTGKEMLQAGERT